MGEGWLIALWVLLGVIGALVALAVLWLVLVQICSWLVDPKKEYRKRNKFYLFLYNTSLVIVLKLMRIKVHYEGEEKLPNERFLAVCNHLSAYDTFATALVFRKRGLGMISKPSNFKTPFFGGVIRKCGYIPIDRENARNAVKDINLASDLIKSEVSMLVYPEGTRNKEVKGLLPFHNSVFKIAHKAGCPVVVMSVRNSEKAKGRIFFHRTDIYLRVIDVIPAEEACAMRTSELGDKARDMILEDEEVWLSKQNQA